MSTRLEIVQDFGNAGDIVAFLQAVDATGTHPIRHIDLTPWGTYRSMHDDAR